MKKVVIAIVLLIGSHNIRAQTEAETLEWLNAKKVDLGRSADIFSIQGVTSYSEGLGSRYKEILWQNIKEISIENQNKNIIIKGKVIERCVSKDCTWDNEAMPGLKILLSYSVNMLDIEKFVKALKHQATLKGAKFLKEDLF